MKRALTRAMTRVMGGAFGYGDVVAAYLMSFSTNATTTTTGERELVNAGTLSVNGEMFMGQGLEPLATVYINTGQFIDTTVPGTLSRVFEIGVTHNGNSDLSGVFDGTNRMYFGNSSATTIAYGIGGTPATNIPHTLATGTMALVVTTWDGAGNYRIDIQNGHAVVTLTEATFVMTQPFIIAGYASSGAHVPNFSQYLPCKDYIYIKGVELTPSEIAQHFNNPEKTLYRVGTGAGSLRSDIASIDSTALTALEAGTGFWYPLSENVLATSGGVHYAVNQAQYESFTVPTATPITGMANTTYRTNAEQLPHGIQRGMYTADTYGVLTTLQSIDLKSNTAADLTSQALSENGWTATITGTEPAITKIEFREA